MTASLTAPATGLAGWTRDWLAALPAPSGDLAPVQQRGRQALAELPVPGSRQEDWRFTDLALLATLPLDHLVGESPAGASTTSRDLPAPEPGVLRLTLDGSTDPLAGVTLPEGLQALTPGVQIEGAVLVGADFSGSGLVVGGEDSPVPPLPPLPPELRKPVNR